MCSHLHLHYQLKAFLIFICTPSFFKPVPSLARDLSIEVFTDSRVQATWSQQETANGDPANLRFRVEYEPTDQTEEPLTTLFGNVGRVNDTTYMISISDLTDDKEYGFKVSTEVEM